MLTKATQYTKTGEATESACPACLQPRLPDIENFNEMLTYAMTSSNTISAPTSCLYGAENCMCMQGLSKFYE